MQLGKQGWPRPTAPARRVWKENKVDEKLNGKKKKKKCKAIFNLVEAAQSSSSVFWSAKWISLHSVFEGVFDKHVLF